MRTPPALCLAAAAAAAASAAALIATAGCAWDVHMVWFCLNPVTGKIDDNIYDRNNYDANGEPDPCHCFDVCGPAASCPELVDAGPLPASCDAGTGDAGP